MDLAISLSGQSSCEKWEHWPQLFIVEFYFSHGPPDSLIPCCKEEFILTNWFLCASSCFYHLFVTGWSYNSYCWAYKAGYRRIICRFYLYHSLGISLSPITHGKNRKCTDNVRETFWSSVAGIISPWIFILQFLPCSWSLASTYQ